MIFFTNKEKKNFCLIGWIRIFSNYFAFRETFSRKFISTSQLKMWKCGNADASRCDGRAFFYRPNLVVWWPTFRCCMLTGQKAFCWPTLWYLSSLTDLDFTYIIHVFQKRIFLAQKLFFYRLLIIRSYFSTDF